MPKLYSIQYLRAFAALAVVYFHAAGRAGLPGWAGAAGVDVFFVISGFIMWTIAAVRERTPAAFLRNRIVRIVPLYWFYTALMLVLAISIPSAFPRFIVDWRHALASFLFVPYRSPYNENELWPILVQGWALNYEMFFYALFAATLLLPPKLRLLVACLIFGALAVCGQLYRGNDPLILTYTNPILLEFAGGMVLGWLRDRKSLPPARLGFHLIVAGLTMFAWTAASHIDSPRLLVWGVPAGLIVGGAVVAEQGALIHLRLLTALGDSSYSTYLVHTFVVSALGKIANPATLPWSFVAIAMGLSMIAGYVSFLLIEWPILQSRKMFKDWRAQ